MFRAGVKPADGMQCFRPNEYCVDVGRTGEEIAESDRATGRHEMSRNAIEDFVRTFNDPAGHSETESRILISGSIQEARDAMRHGHIVVVQKNDVFTSRDFEAAVARMANARPGTIQNTKPRFAAVNRSDERPSIIDDHDLDTLMRLLIHRGQCFEDALRPYVRRDDCRHFGVHGPFDGTRALEPASVTSLPAHCETMWSM